MVSVLDLIIPSLLKERYLFTCSPMSRIMWPLRTLFVLFRSVRRFFELQTSLQCSGWIRFAPPSSPPDRCRCVVCRRGHRERKCADTIGTVLVPWIGLPILKYKYIFSNKIHGSNFIKQHSETVMVWNFQDADCCLRSKFIASFVIIFGTLSFPILGWRYSPSWLRDNETTTAVVNVMPVIVKSKF